jgi:prevent-host-death family protein
MSTIGASQFKQECLAILDRLGPEGIVITKHGKPIAKLVPIETDSASLIGSLAGKIRVHGDFLSTGLRWDAESCRALRGEYAGALAASAEATR